MPKPNGSNIFNVLNVPAYSIAEATRLVNMNYWTVRRYLQGYSYEYEGQKRSQPPVVKSDTKADIYASFLDLIDLLFVREFLSRGFGLPTLREALDEAREWLGAPHFSQSLFFTTSADQIALQMPSDGSMVVLLTGGQGAMTQIVEMFSDRLNFEDVTKYGFVRRWYPKGKDGLIVIDPEISFGRPTLMRTGIPTNNIYDLFLGENKSVEPVSEWFEIPVPKIEAAVQFEQALWA